MADIWQAGKWMQEGKIVGSADNGLPNHFFRGKILDQVHKTGKLEMSHRIGGIDSWTYCYGFGMADLLAEDWQIAE